MFSSSQTRKARLCLRDSSQFLHLNLSPHCLSPLSFCFVPSPSLSPSPHPSPSPSLSPSTSPSSLSHPPLLTSPSVCLSVCWSHSRFVTSPIANTICNNPTLCLTNRELLFFRIYQTKCWIFTILHCIMFAPVGSYAHLKLDFIIGSHSPCVYCVQGGRQTVAP